MSAFPCITGFSQLTDAALAWNASAVVQALYRQGDPVRRSANIVTRSRAHPTRRLTLALSLVQLYVTTLADSADYVAVIPTFGINAACLDRLRYASTTLPPVHVALPALSGGVVVGPGGTAPSGSSVTLGGLGSLSPPAPALAAVPSATLLAQASDGTRLCASGRCRVGQASYNPATAPAATLPVTFVWPSASCSLASVRPPLPS